MGKLVVPYALRDDFSVIDFGKPCTPVLNDTDGLQWGQEFLKGGRFSSKKLSSMVKAVGLGPPRGHATTYAARLFE